jgi:hypothetical protein
MLGYAWRTLTRRPSLWPPALALALMAAIPGSIAALFLARPGTGLLVSGDLVLAARLLPPGLRAPLPVVLAGAVVGALVALCVWSRIYAAAVWASSLGNDTALAAGWRATRSEWRSVALLYAQVWGAVAVGVALVVALVLAGASPGTGLLLLSLVIVARTVLRVGLTVAVRVAVFEGESGRRAWRRAREMIAERRTDATALWVALLACGVGIWIGGRLIAPVVQETALDYAAGTVHTFAREGAHLLVAVPLEGFLIALALAAWTGFYEGEAAGSATPAPQRRGADQWAVRGLAGIVILTIAANGIATLVESSFDAEREDAVAEINEREVPVDRLLSPPPNQDRRSGTRYEVTAGLDDRSLEWDTRITYTNTTAELLDTISLNLYPAAYDRSIEKMPLGRELLANDLDGSVRREVEPATFQVVEVLVEGRTASANRSGTALTVLLPKPLRPEVQTQIDISLSARLPVYPERFGTWGGITLLGNWIPVIAHRTGGEWRTYAYGSIGDPFVSEVADYHVEIQAGEHQRIAGSGVLTEIRAGPAGTRIWVFEAPAVRDAAFAVSPYLRALETTSRGVVVRSWYPAESALVGSANLATAASAVADYTERFGPLPFTEVEVVTTYGVLGGMEYPGIVFTAQAGGALEGLPLLPGLLRYAGFTRAQERYVIGHEVAHQWWYAAVGNDQVVEPWLDEGFAELSTRLWLRSKEGDDRTWMMTNFVPDSETEEGVVSAAVEDFATNTGYTRSVYLAGSKVLLNLRSRVGSARFDEIMRVYYRRNFLEIASVDEFVEVVADVAGPGPAAYVESFR